MLFRSKTRVQAVAIVADLSPLGEKLPRIVHAIHAGSLVMTAVSGFDVIANANQQIAEDELASAQVHFEQLMPPHLLQVSRD